MSHQKKNQHYRPITDILPPISSFALYLQIRVKELTGEHICMIGFSVLSQSNIVDSSSTPTCLILRQDSVENLGEYGY